MAIQRRQVLADDNKLAPRDHLEKLALGNHTEVIKHTLATLRFVFQDTSDAALVRWNRDHLQHRDRL